MAYREFCAEDGYDKTGLGGQCACLGRTLKGKLLDGQYEQNW